jgi:hypothetical protein
MLYENPKSCLDVIVSEIASPPIDSQYEDPLLAYAPLLFTIPVDSQDQLLLESLTKRYIPALLDDPRYPFRADQSRSIAQVVRLSVLLLNQIKPERATVLVTALVEEVRYQRSRGVEHSADLKVTPKKRKAGVVPRGLSSAAGTLVELLAHAFDDEESKARWEIVKSL